MVSRRLPRWQVRGAAAAGAVLLVAGPSPAHAAVPGAGEALRVTGAALVHVFDLSVPGDQVTGEWVVAAETAAVAYDGVLEVRTPATSALAPALVVEYGRVAADGSLLGWYGAGTVAEPLTYGAALGVSPTARATAPTRIPVRVSLPDPGPVRHALDADDDALVEATFTVSYLADGHGSGPPGQAAGSAAGPGPGALAVTGGGLAAAGAAVALLTVGAALARAARRTRVARDVLAPRP